MYVIYTGDQKVTYHQEDYNRNGAMSVEIASKTANTEGWQT